MRSDHFENLTPVRKIVDLSPLFLYLEETLYGYHVIDFFLLLMARGMFQPNWSIFEFYPHITFDLGFHSQNAV